VVVTNHFAVVPGQYRYGSKKLCGALTRPILLLCLRRKPDSRASGKFAKSTMKLRMLVYGLVSMASLYGQRRFSWQNACFNNLSAPYCAGRDFAIKPTKNGAAATPGTYMAPSPSIDAAGIDWRFADPSADALAVLDCRKLSASPVARGLIDRLGAAQGLSQADVQNIVRGLSSVDQVALSVRDNRIVLMAVGRARDTILPAPQAGWKSISLAGNELLIGHAEAVDQAAQRILSASPLGELAGMAQQRQGNSDFWAAGSVKVSSQEAVAAGVKRFSLTASMQDRLTGDTAFEFNAAPDANAIQPWMNTLGDARIEGSIVHAGISMDANETRQNFDKIAVSPLGQRLAVLIKSARDLPVRDSATTVHTKPVIYGLEDGAKEVSQYTPSPSAVTPPSSERPAIPPASSASSKWTWVIQSVAVEEQSKTKYSSFYYEAATDRSVEKPLTLPAGAAIVGVFPDDCMFSVSNELGKSITFRNEAEAKAKGLEPGSWSVSPLKCSGVAVFLK
jgi:hypothetical protein